MKKKKARKPDAADRIALWANGWVDTREFRVGVAARIRRAIKAAERKGAQSACDKIAESVNQIRGASFTKDRVHPACLCDGILRDIAAVRAAKESR